MVEITGVAEADRNPIILADPQKELLADAAQTDMREEIPDPVLSRLRLHLGIFGTPGIRALTYVIVDGEVWPKTSEFRDLVTFQAPDAEGRVDIQPFSEPAKVDWRPDAGTTDASVSLDLHQHESDSDALFLATETERGLGQEPVECDVPHIVVGWHEVPEPDAETSDAATQPAHE